MILKVFVCVILEVLLKGHDDLTDCAARESSGLYATSQLIPYIKCQIPMVLMWRCCIVSKPSIQLPIPDQVINLS